MSQVTGRFTCCLTVLPNAPTHLADFLPFQQRSLTTPELPLSGSFLWLRSGLPHSPLTCSSLSGLPGPRLFWSGEPRESRRGTQGARGSQVSSWGHFPAVVIPPSPRSHPPVGRRLRTGARHTWGPSEREKEEEEEEERKRRRGRRQAAAPPRSPLSASRRAPQATALPRDPPEARGQRPA